MSIELTCWNCDGKSFFFDEESDRVCYTCGRIQIDDKKWKHRPNITLVTPPQNINPQKLATERYRRSNLYRQTRKKHDGRYERSSNGKEQRKLYREYTATLKTLAKAIFTAQQRNS